MRNAHPLLTLDDRPAEKDALNFIPYCLAFKDLITNPRTHTPLAVGIFGRWGTGKTTFMSLLREELRQKGLATVWFNAWQYNQEEELWAAFLQSLLNQASDDLHLSEKIKFYLNLFKKRTDWKKALKLAAQTLLRVLVVITPLILAWPLVQQWWSGPYQVVLKLAGGAVAVGAGWWGAMMPMIEAVRKDVKMDFSSARKTSDYQQHIAFLDKFRAHFTDIVKSLPPKNNVHLAVFIDDLDRCAPDRALQVLDAIKLFVDVPGCFFVLGLDDVLIQKAVQEKYQDSLEEQQHYLDKIVQLSFHIPPFTRPDIENFISSLKVDLPDPRCLQVFAAGSPSNPRQVKRFLNLFSLGAYLTKKHGSGRTTLQPVLLAKVIMLQHLFPELYDLVREQPELLTRLEAHFRLKDETELPDHLLILHQLFTARFEQKNLPLLVYHFGSAKDIPADKIMARVEALADELDRDNRLGELVQWGMEQENGIPWQTISREIETARQKHAFAPALPDELLPFASNKTLRKLLLLFKQEADAGFSGLGEQQLSPYFSLTRQMKAHLTDELAVPEAALSQAASTPLHPAA